MTAVSPLRLKPSALHVLDLLRERGSLTQLEALHLGAGFRLAARIAELREAHFDIETDMSAGFARYTLREAGQLAVWR